MKLVSYQRDDQERVAILHEGLLYNLSDLDNRFPPTMIAFLQGEQKLMDLAIKYNQRVLKGEYSGKPVREYRKVQKLSPLPRPVSLRDAYAFRQHVETARKNRGLDMIPEFDQFPVFYFSNHNAIVPSGEIKLMPDHFQRLDYELEVAIVIGKKGKNIKASEADQHIAGFLILNDVSARTLQMEEMKLSLGPAKGKDFASVLGPWLVTPDELSHKKVNASGGHVGNTYDLKMQAYLNDQLLSEGNLKDMHWTFAEIIERISYGVELLPGEVIGSGTVGTGCLLELNGTGKRSNDNYKEQWILPGDKVKLVVEGLGEIENTFKLEDSKYSIMDTKKGKALRNK